MVKCKVDGCRFYICVRANVKVEGVIVKDFSGQHRHSVGDQCQIGEGGKRKMRATLLAQLIDGKIKLSVDYSVVEIMKDWNWS